MAETPEGYSLGGRIELPKINGWILTPPTSQESINKLISCSIFDKSEADKASYHGIFLSHTGVDKPFARRLKNDLVNRGVPRVWLDEAEIDIGDSLIRKIEEGMRETKYIGVVLSEKSIKAPWVLRELDIAINREISGGEVAVLPLLYEKCELPTFLQGKLYADFTDTENYEEVIQKLLRRLKINKH